MASVCINPKVSHVKAVLGVTLLSKSKQKRTNPIKAIKSLCIDLSSLTLLELFLNSWVGLECRWWCWLPVKVPVNATMWLKCVLPVPRRHHGAGVCEARGTGPVPEEEHVCLSQLETRRGQTTGLCSQLPGETYPPMHVKLTTNDKIQNYSLFRTISVSSFNLLVLVDLSVNTEYYILKHKKVLFFC